MWWNQRRPEILEDFDREVLGRVPNNVPKVTWEVTNKVEFMVGSHPVVGRQIVGHVDNSSYPLIEVNIQMTLVTPAGAKDSVPVMMMFGGGGGLPQPGAPSQQELIADGWGYASVNPGSIQADSGGSRGTGPATGLTRGIRSLSARASKNWLFSIAAT